MGDNKVRLFEMMNRVANLPLNEEAAYHDTEDGGQITIVNRDNYHSYKYSDGVLYELSTNGGDIEVNIDEVSETEENTFYEDQINRYVEYISNGGVLESLPVRKSSVAGNLLGMVKYLEDDIDLLNELVSGDLYYNFDSYDIESEYQNYGFTDEIYHIINADDLDQYYIDKNDPNFDVELYENFKDILEHFEGLDEYSLTDSNHRFRALKELGKRYIMVDPD